ncbi:MAG: cation transporter [Actinomycetota bacterium]
MVTHTHAAAATASPERRAVLSRRIRLFVAATITYNVIEAVVALAAGSAANSSALIGFGLDSLIEVSSAAAVAWQFAGLDPETREKKALRFIAFSFFALAAFVTVDALRSLLVGREADHSTIGIVLAALSLAIMPVLSWAQRRAGRELGSRSAVADSKQTLLCTYLSAVLLVGLLLNSTMGWWWADPLAALVIAAVAVKEGLEAWRGDSCCAPGMHLNVEDEVPVMGAAGTLVQTTAQRGKTLALSTKQKSDTCSCCTPDQTDGSK